MREDRTLLLGAVDLPPLDLPLWSVVPFALTLLAIASLPLLAPAFWHKNRNQALVVVVLGLPAVVYLVLIGPATRGASLQWLGHELANYASFLALLASLYTVAGGVLIEIGGTSTPIRNTAILAAGAVLANLTGTTGASMLLIRPFLRGNRGRAHAAHLPIFFIFLVSNLGGLLTPLGDPPLFLGYLNGISFFWTLTLWLPWLLANGCVLAVFLAWDWRALRREQAGRQGSPMPEAFRLRGLVNFVYLGAILAAVLLQPRLPTGVAETIMIGALVLSLVSTPAGVRAANEFAWGPLLEVAILFAGIFVTMVPALALLKARGPALGLTQPWQFFWLTGLLSSILDNAPTYLSLATLAAAPHDLAWLEARRPDILAAISCGAVFMGANTYIGNGPNFMVKAIAEHLGVKAPSFFGYVVYSSLVLLPVFALVTWLFFAPQ